MSHDEVKDLPGPVADAVEVWRRAQVLDESPSWRGKPEGSAACESLAQHKEYEAAISSLLQHSSQLVVAYAIRTLHLMKSPILRSLPGQILQRREKVTVHSGSFRTGSDLGGYARHIQKIANEKAT
jgi:hypothetical protein